MQLQAGQQDINDGFVFINKMGYNFIENNGVIYKNTLRPDIVFNDDGYRTVISTVGNISNFKQAYFIVDTNY